MSGCATIIDGSTTKMNITSNVDDVKILLNGGEIGRTPFFGEVPKPESSTTQIVFKKKGYETTTITVGRTIVPITFVSIIFWDLGTTDFLTGNAFTYSRNSIFVELEPKELSMHKKKIYDKQANMRKFILQNYEEVFVQVVAGEGEYFNYITDSIGVDQLMNEPIDNLLSKKINEVDMVLFARFVADNISQ